MYWVLVFGHMFSSPSSAGLNDASELDHLKGVQIPTKICVFSLFVATCNSENRHSSKLLCALELLSTKRICGNMWNYLAGSELKYSLCCLSSWFLAQIGLLRLIDESTPLVTNRRFRDVDAWRGLWWTAGRIPSKWQHCSHTNRKLPDRRVAE